MTSGIDEASSPRCTAARRGFTLVELLITIGIILVLIGLILPVIAASMKIIREVKTGSIISYIGIGLETFKQDFKFYPPSSPGSSFNEAWGLGSGAEALRFYLMGGSDEGWPHDNQWPDQSAAGIGAPRKGPYADPKLAADAETYFYDGFEPPILILYWSANPTERNASDVYVMADNPDYGNLRYDFYHMLCGNKSGGAPPVNSDTYILLSAGIDRQWGYRNPDGGAVGPDSFSANCDDIGNFKPFTSAVAE
ncbi:MAG: prepilin-type N-terminal cleavage/methylation domain-containing protein [Phycisphaerae bacterium]|nr:prepilin-type N-terminal cleavage/methylation domain-containing protein [Phycisphaerae bacterium]